jgi:hypothetical protein
MIRHRVDKHGHIYPLDPPSSYPVLDIPPAHVGAINPELIRKWLAAKHEWDIKFSKEKLRVQSRRMKELAHGFQDFDGECPPASSLAARRAAPGVLPKRHAKKNYGMMLWSGWGSKHDERTIERERQAIHSGRPSTRPSVDAGQAGAWSSTPLKNSQSNTGGNHDLSQEKSHASGPTSVTWDKKEHPNNNGDSSTGRMSTEPDSASRPLSEKSGPILILPEVDNRKLTDENASTRALFHAAGTLPMKSDISLSNSRYRPESAAGSVTGRSEMVSDTASTVGGDKDSVARMNLGTDSASTRAVLGAKGVIPLMASENGRLSSDTLSVFSAAGRDSMSHRPEMPDREVFKTAEEGL